MDDIEKQRVEYVAELEQQVKYLQEELAKFKPLAEKWEPKVVGSIDPHDKQVRFTLSFGGKRVTAVVSLQKAAANNVDDITTSVADTLFESLVVEKIRDALRPEVARLQPAAVGVMGAGTW